jgi:NhaP-type Na+/H+ or K+/H+ antiporter
MGGDGESDQNVLLFIFIGLTLGSATTHFLSTVGNNCVPYTVVVFIEGIILSALNSELGLGDFGDSLERWLEIEADLILYVFLPALLFGEAMSLNWYNLGRSLIFLSFLFFILISSFHLISHTRYQIQGGFAQALLLAGPGVVMGAFMMGGLAHLIFPSWPWNLAMVFGSILSATDPVAVVALLKETGLYLTN